MRYLICSLLILTCFSSLYSQGDDLGIKQLKKTSHAFNQVAERANPAVVSISTLTNFSIKFRSPFHEFYGLDHQQVSNVPEKALQQGGLGSGVLISGDGYVLTNHHVINEVDEITVTLSDGREFAAKQLGSDPKTDIALLKITGRNLPSIKVGNVKDVKVGDWAIAIGNPFGLQNTLTVGVISALGRSSEGAFSDFIQTDAAINPGNSGGALLNIEGELIGINSAIYSQAGGGFMGIGFAVPVNTAIRVMKDLKTQGHVSKGWLGIQVQNITPDLKQKLNLTSKKGALINNVIKGGPGELAGLNRGDIIIKYNGSIIQESKSLTSKVMSAELDQFVTLTILRNNQRKVLKVKVTKHSLNNTNYNGADRLGLKVEPLSEKTRRRFRIRGKNGLVITKIKPGSLAFKKGFKVGMIIKEVNYTQVDSITSYRKIIANSQEILMLVNFRGYNKYLVVHL
ncbi:peptidase [Candidatus Marinamargulisbacteria bacterium SCGC AAA071-K20]|nr:peptidase [Candidatus Marinamargulisbacteria bacterium SCGC AAA071-K20]